MSLFEITPDIQLLAKPITPGWHAVEVTKIEDGISDKVGQDGKPLKKTTFTHKIFEGPHKGAMVWVTVTHDAKEPSPTIQYNLPYLDYISKGAFTKPITKAEQRTLTMDNIVKQFDAQITNKDVGGAIMNNIKKVRKLTSLDEKNKVSQ